MFSFAEYMDLPLIWGGLIATAVFLYVLLDGFDLGIGILFPFAPTHQCRDRMMNSIAPFWDGNETWLVLGGGGLFAAFPLAYAIIMPAVYLPVIAMLLGLIFRGVAFEFRFKETGKYRIVWDYAFHFGSLVAAFMQGVILGAVVQGIEVDGRQFVGDAFDWLTPFSLMTGVALVFGYALLGATWVVMKTDEDTQMWARRVARYVLGFVGIFMGMVSIAMLFQDRDVSVIWFSTPNIYFLVPIPFITLALFVRLWRDLVEQRHFRPFFLSLGIFSLGYIGLGVSIWPWIVPYDVSLWKASAAPESQSLLLVGTAIMLPIILAYTGYCYYLFRGKTSHEALY